MNNRVKEERLQQGISQGKLSKACGIAKENISRIETGAIPNPTIWTCLRLAEALQVSVGNLFFYTSKKPTRK